MDLERISHYTIIREIGRGGMGVLYEAKDTRLGRAVALKFLLPRYLEDDVAKSRFVREAKAAAALDHPNICTVYDIEEMEGRCFIAMPYVDGVSLRQKLESGALEPDEAIGIAIQIARGLSAAHGKEIVHRDIKPGNILLGNDGQVRITDFGLVQLADQERITRTDETVGTIRYMSPEQVRGETVDRRADIWALGVVLYEMLTGKRPFAGDFDEAVRYSILNRKPGALEDKQEGVPDPLKPILRKALAKEAGKRYQSVEDMAADLETAGDSLRAAESPDAPPPARRRNTVVGAVVAAVVMLVVVAWIVTHDQGATARTIAVLPLDNLSGDPQREYFSDGLTDALIADLAQVSALRVISRRSVMQYKGRKRPLPEIAKELNADVAVAGSVLFEGEEVRITAELIDAKRNRLIWADSYDRHLSNILALQNEIANVIVKEIRVRLTPEETKRLARPASVAPDCYQLYLKGRYFWNKREQNAIRKSIELFEAAIRVDSSYAPAYVGLADAFIVLPVYDPIPIPEANAAARRAAIEALSLDENLSGAYAALGAIEQRNWRWLKSEEYYKRAVALTPSDATAHKWYGELLSLVGRHDEAMREIRLARELDPLSLVTSVNTGVTYMLAGRYDEAVRYIDAALEMDSTFAFAYHFLGDVFARMSRHDDAVAAWRKELELTGHSGAELASFDEAYRSSGWHGYWRWKIDSLLEKPGGAPTRSSMLAVAYAAIDETDIAIEWLERAYQERDVLLPYRLRDPAFAALQSDERFATVSHKVGLPAQD
jgi:serine/threonine-protein kinase